MLVTYLPSLAIWPREVASCRDFILRAVATFWAMSLVGIYPGRAHLRQISLDSSFIINFDCQVSVGRNQP